MFLRWVDGKAQVADALTKLLGNGDLLRVVCPQTIPETVSFCGHCKKGHLVYTRTLPQPCFLFTNVTCFSIFVTESNTFSSLHKFDL